MHAQWQPFASDHLTTPKVNDDYAQSVQPFPDTLLLICDVLKLKPRINQGKFDILESIHFGQEKELLKDKANLLISNLG